MPVDFVRTCSIDGTFTGFVVPGSDVCLKLGGFVRYQYSAAQPDHTFFYRPGVGGYAGASGRSLSAGDQTATASVQLDARTTTEYGLLRSFADVRVDSTGVAQIDKGYIQFGQWSFGKFQSFFDFYADAYSNITGLGSDNSLVGAAYSVKITDELFLTVALEERSNPLSPFATFTAPAGIGRPTADGTGVPSSIGGLTSGGQRVPDAVAQLLYDAGPKGWGSTQLSGAVHQVRADTSTASVSETRYGWAAQAGVKFNLGKLAEGDGLYLQAAYTNGALSYVGANNAAGGFGTTAPLVQYYDAVAVGPASSVKTTRGYNILAAFDHFWRPSFDTSLYAGYTKVDYASGLQTGETFAGRDFGVLQVGGQATWVPVTGLKIAGALNWYAVDVQKKGTDYIGGLKAIDDKAAGLQAQLRIQRDF